MSIAVPFWMHIPGLRGWIVRLRSWRDRRRLLAAYRTFRTCAAFDTVAEISFGDSRCVFELRDGRSYIFDPSRAAGWLYSVPFSGCFEYKETNYLQSIIRPGSVCFDVGACFGWYTVLLSQRAGQRGAVYAFEPIAPNRECLIANLALNECRNVTVNAKALGENPGHVDMFLPRHGVSASFRPHGGSANCARIGVEVTTLDAYVAEAGVTRLDFVKADIEGAELQLLKGGVVTLRKFRPVLMLEVQAHSTRLFGYEPAEVFALLAELGYAAYMIAPEGTLMAYRGAGAAPLPDYNFIFRHPGALA